MSPSRVARRTWCKSGVTRSTKRNYGHNHTSFSCPLAQEQILCLEKPPCIPRESVLPCTTPGQNQLQRISTCNYWSTCKAAFLPASQASKSFLKHPPGQQRQAGSPGWGWGAARRWWPRGGSGTPWVWCSILMTARSLRPLAWSYWCCSGCLQDVTGLVHSSPSHAGGNQL